MKILKLLNRINLLFFLFFFLIFLNNTNAEDEPVDIWKLENSTEENLENQNQFLKLVKDITSKGFVRSDYKRKLVDLSDIRINLKGKK